MSKCVNLTNSRSWHPRHPVRLCQLRDHFECARASLQWMVSFLVLGMALPTLHGAEVDAVVGQPFGVGALTIQSGESMSPLVTRSDGYQLEDPAGRVLYPVVRATYAREGGVLTQLLGLSTSVPRSVTVHFLFQGDAPFDIQWNDGTRHVVRVHPRPPARREHQRLVNRWWREFQATGAEAPTAGDELLHQYVTWRLSGQLELPPRLQPRSANQSESDDDQSLRTLQLVAGAESLRAEVRGETLSQAPSRSEVADQPLPPMVEWLPPAIEVPEDIEIEPIASRVPADCFYIRFGSFPNYLWLSQLLSEYGGDLAGMVAPQPLRQAASDRVQRQLGLKQSVLAEVMGPAVISDVALIGHDLYMSEGAAIGILFQARNPLLGRDLAKQRRTAMAEMKQRGATEESVMIGGRDVSLISTPDFQLRSFYVSDGDYHLVTTSRRLVEQFLDTGNGRGTLSELPEFHHARKLLPLEREDTVFVYFSTPFLQNLVSPHYQIERLRRLRAATDMELLVLAGLEASGQGMADAGAEQLIERGFLPRAWAQRPEPGEVVLRDGELLDTLRGGRGSFVPISDVEITEVTRSELNKYQRQAEFYQQNWRQFDPLMVAVQRTALNRDGLERIAVEAHLTPLNESKYGKYLSILGPPATHQVAPVPGDIVSLQAFVQGGRWARSISPHLLFLGIQDAPPVAPPTGLLQILNTLRSTPGYLGAWPQMGFLDWLPVWIGGGEPDAQGYSQLLLGLWRRQWGDISVLSFQRPVLDQVTPDLQVEEAPAAAQIRLYVGDISQAQVRDFVSQLAIERSLETSIQHAGFLHRLSEQLRFPRDEGLSAAELLLDGRLVCPVSSEPYALWELGDGGRVWASPAWAESNPMESYEAPFLDWFRGLNADLTRDPAGILIRAELDMQRKREESPSSIPLFDFFKSRRPSAAPLDADSAGEKASNPEKLPAPRESNESNPRRREF